MFVHFRQARGLSEQPPDQTTLCHSSDGDSVKVAATSTNSASESGLGRNTSNMAEIELHACADSGSVGPTNISGRKSNMRRNER